MALDDFGMNAIKRGLLSQPPYISSKLTWTAKNGQDLYQARSKSLNFYKWEEMEIKKCTNDIISRLGSKLAIFDLGAGLCSKTTTMFEALIGGKPDVKVCYVPVDVSHVVNSWKDHLCNQYPQFMRNIVHIIPIVGDLFDTVHNSDKILQDTRYQEWDKLFIMYGPNTSVIGQDMFLELAQAISNQVKGTGGYMFTYIPELDGLREMLTAEIYSKMDFHSFMKSFIEGLATTVAAEIDPDWFEYKQEFVYKKTTPGIEGTWAGQLISAYAKQDLEFTCGKLDGLRISLKKGDPIRLSDEEVKSHYYSHQFLESLADMCSLKIYARRIEPGRCIACTFLSSK